MSYQPVSADPYTLISAAGTTVLKDIGARVQRLSIGGTYVGTVEFYDSATAAGTAATNLIGTYGLPTTNTFRSLELGIRTRNGLTYVATGTPTLLLVWE